MKSKNPAQRARTFFTADTHFGEGDIRAGIPRFHGDAHAHNMRLVELLGDIARSKGATTGQIALAWLLALKPWIVPIPGTTRMHRMEENAAATAISLGADDMARIEAAAAAVPIEGTRYPPAMMALVER